MSDLMDIFEASEPIKFESMKTMGCIAWLTPDQMEILGSAIASRIAVKHVEWMDSGAVTATVSIDLNGII